MWGIDMRITASLNGVITELQYDANTKTYYADIEAPAESSILLDDVYYPIDITAVGEHGETDATMIPLYVSPEFVYDRTREDVELAVLFRDVGYHDLDDEDKELWRQGLKGALNTSDLQRIENNMYGIAHLLELIIQTNKDDIPALRSMKYFREMRHNLNLLRAGGKKGAYIWHSTPRVPNSPINYYTKVNDIEKMLFDIWNLYTSILLRHEVHVGEIYSGEDLI